MEQNAPVVGGCLVFSIQVVWVLAGAPFAVSEVVAFARYTRGAPLTPGCFSF